MTAPTEAQWTAMSKILQQMINRSDTEPFRVPVDWKGMGLFDYPTLIKKPMDLGTVKKNLSGRKYKTIPEAANDIRLVWSNCMTYNQDGSDFFLLAKNLSKKFEEKYGKFLTDNNIVLESPSSSAPHNAHLERMITLDEKRIFAKSLYTLSKDDLGKLIVEVDHKCPAALTKNAGEDEAELNVDKITQPLFKELQTFVANCTKETPATKKGGTKRKA